MKGTYLGEFEELVLLTVGALHPEAYGVAIMDEIEKEAGRSVNISAIHSALRRLDEKGFVKSELGGATAERGGRSKRIFELTAFGKKALDEAQGQRMKLYNRIQDISFGN
ncbi:MAG: PadR family transcriptional regulator PadR [Roseivirga sp.]|jgi:PadR family transcriptional regulator PadR